MTRGGQRSLPIVGVMGSGADADAERCGELGAWLARQEVHLLTGGGRGVMEAVSRGFSQVADRSGLVIGIIPCATEDPSHTPAGYPNPWVELPIRTHLSLSGTQGTEIASRNHINILSSDVVIALPGAWGTRSEIDLALRYGRPLVAYLQDRSDIPQLPDRVPVRSRLEEVQAFVLEVLGRAP